MDMRNLCGVGLLLVVASGCGGGGATASPATPAVAAPAKSPEEVFARANAAAKGDKFAEILPLFPPDEHAMMTYTIFVISGKIAGDVKDPAAKEAATTALAAITKARGVKEQKGVTVENVGDAKVMREAAAKGLDGVDKAALFGDLVGFLEKHGTKDTSFKHTLSGELKDLKVNGNEAEGKVNDSPFNFVKIGEAWYLAVK